jgi:hypothetical protein
MMQIALIGVGAGAAAALLFASVTSGALLSVFLFYLAPLPIMIAALGWTHWAGLTAAIVATIALAAIFGTMFAVAFLAGVSLPAWWLSYLTLLARPGVSTDGASAPALEWYPPGRVVIWAAAVGAAAVIVSILTFGWDAESFRKSFGDMLAQLMRTDQAATPSQLPGGLTAQQIVDFMVVALPPTAAVTLTLTKVFNLWLAGRIVRFSGRLPRPWPELSQITLPPTTAYVFIVAFALSLTGGFFGILAGVVSASLAMAYTVLGFAVLHAVTQGLNGRPFILGSLYASVVLLQGWPMLGVCLVGLIETFLGLRARVVRRRGPPVT